MGQWQARSQEFAMRGLFWRLETTSNNHDPDFGQSSLRLSRFFCPNLGVLQKKRRKVFSQIEAQFFWSNSHQVHDQFSSPIPMGGTIFVCSTKIGLKSAKNGVFCILFRPIGGCSPPPGYATGYC